MKNKTIVNYIVDIFMLVSFLVTATTGVLIFLFLPPAEGKRGVHNELLDWGRHDWGAIHDWAGIIMLLTVVVHLVLHWNWIVCMTKNIFQKKGKCKVESEDNAQEE